MTRLLWACLHHLSQWLEPDEREAVVGDLTETRAPLHDWLRSVGGLVVRRQVALWGTWRPWLGLIACAVPCGWWLGRLARWFSNGSAIYGWLYLNNWTWSFLTNPGARRDLLHYTVVFVVSAALLAAWSWTVGFALASLSRRALVVTGGVFFLALLVELLDVPAPRPSDGHNAVVFASALYRILWPLALRATVIVCPAILGIRRGRRACAVQVSHAALLAISIAVAALWASGATAPYAAPWWNRALPILLTWPGVYVVITAMSARASARMAN